MFGYVKPFIPNLRVKEYELYKSVYCGLCRSMQKHTGGISRMTLSFDMTFFALVRLALQETDYTIRKRRCFVHPVRRRPMMDDNPELMFSAYVSAVLICHKLEDTIVDEKGLKRLGAKMLSPYAKGLRRRAEKSAEEITDIVSQSMKRLSELEAERCAVPDMPADVFGDMLGKLLSVGLSEKRLQTVAYEIGLHTGRWVYLTDAVFDYEEDMKKGSYNPFLLAFEGKEEMARFQKETLRGIMTMEADAIARALDFIDFEGRAMLHDCIENIIYDGMESSLSVAYGKELTDGERSL